MCAWLTSEYITVTQKVRFNSEICKLDFTAHCLSLAPLLPAPWYSSYDDLWSFPLLPTKFSITADLSLIRIHPGILGDSRYHWVNMLPGIRIKEELERDTLQHTPCLTRSTSHVYTTGYQKKGGRSASTYRLEIKDQSVIDIDIQTFQFAQASGVFLNLSKGMSHTLHLQGLRTDKAVSKTLFYVIGSRN